ncbi:GGDEF domain-containing phosphodiesterase [Paracoccus marinaquae]|uniref:GGDEF domain-containing phosphodiesterase n=1 Tax=Paracoccus marinaquae TaxID=2841926 RepID=A0ABS6AM61_9RHOB|nr:GGDEF domain-containing phosphodiesterase [Paracoccus marinaquae]MBU3031664.1 GGDEF domain-containing phosphodiesterase [Paracoccus marinaquae]
MWAKLRQSGQALWRAMGPADSTLQAAGAQSVLLLRLENVEPLAEHLGKAGFSHLLVKLSMRLSRAIRPDDPVQIIAQGLFGITLRNRSEEEAMRIARRLQDRAQKLVPVAGLSVTPVLSGVLVHAGNAIPRDPVAMLRSARSRLDDLAAERLGTIALFDHDSEIQAPDLPATIAEAAAAGQITAYFQPQISCHSGEVTGFEALARWQHPTRGLLLPGSFMARMGEQDHKALTLAMLRQAIAALRSWDAAGWQVPTVSLNISNSELSDPGFAAGLLWELDRQDVRPDRLVLEVLESVAPVTSSPAVRANISALSRAGCRLDLDDFGTGYASLDAIRQFGVHRIKIDRSFVMGCDIDDAQQRMILAILALAERLGISALAEGVESREEHAFLAQMGCDEVQGYAIARPMPLSETLDFLLDHARHRGALPAVPRSNAG